MSGDTETAGKHLWEGDHPYRCEDGNFYERGYAHHFNSWAEFVNGESYYEADEDLNLLFRWDWHAYHLKYPDDYPPGTEEHVLKLHYIMQRKPKTASASIRVTAEDEPAIREWLTMKYTTIRAIWNPLDPT